MARTPIVQRTAVSGIAGEPRVFASTAATTVFLLLVIITAFVLSARVVANKKDRRLPRILFILAAAAVIGSWGVEHVQHYYRLSTVDGLRSVALPAPSSTEVPRRSLRAGPAAVSVEWPSLAAVVGHVGATLWDSRRSLHADFQAVLLYGKGDFFRKHRDQFERSDQVAVLVVDVGFRPEGSNYTASTWRWKGREEQVELTIDPPARTFMPRKEQHLEPFHWSPSRPGAWVAFSIESEHEVHVVASPQRAVAVFTLWVPHEGLGMCIGWNCAMT